VNAAGEAAAMGAFALSFPAAGLVINLLGVRGAYAMAALGCVLAAAILVPAMRAARAVVSTPEPEPVERIENTYPSMLGV
jgi:hypothetical protein